MILNMNNKRAIFCQIQDHNTRVNLYKNNFIQQP